jgi:hypothetical protein
VRRLNQRENTTRERRETPTSPALLALLRYETTTEGDGRKYVREGRDDERTAARFEEKKMKIGHRLTACLCSSDAARTSHLLRLRVLPNVASGGSEEDFVLDGPPQQKIVDMEKQTRACRYRRLVGGKRTGIQRSVSPQT